MRRKHGDEGNLFSTYADSLDQMSRALAERFDNGGRLFAMGNGGSLCDALHIAVEFNHPIIEKRLAFPPCRS